MNFEFLTARKFRCIRKVSLNCYSKRNDWKRLKILSFCLLFLSCSCMPAPKCIRLWERLDLMSMFVINCFHNKANIKFTTKFRCKNCNNHRHVMDYLFWIRSNNSKSIVGILGTSYLQTLMRKSFSHEYEASHTSVYWKHSLLILKLPVLSIITCTLWHTLFIILFIQNSDIFHAATVNKICSLSSVNSIVCPIMSQSLFIFKQFQTFTEEKVSLFALLRAYMRSDEKGLSPQYSHCPQMTSVWRFREI